MKIQQSWVGKKKDFGFIWIFQHYSLQQLMDWHKQNIPAKCSLSAFEAITIFFDLTKSETPVEFKKTNLEAVKRNSRAVAIISGKLHRRRFRR